MTATAIRITGGKLYDPAHHHDGVVRDVLLHDGKVVDALPENAIVRTIDARGCIVMPGGVEMHAHIASPAVNQTRMIQSVADYDTVVPSAPQTGRLYAQMGYTTVIEPAVSPGGAASAHRQLDDTPNLDTGLLMLMGNHEALVEKIHRGDLPGAVEQARQLLVESRGFGIKAVNPAAVAAWRRQPTMHHIDSLDQTVHGSKVSPRVMLDVLVRAVDEIGLSHALHIHGPQLGEPGNVTITTDMIRHLQGNRFHLAHLQYYCYGHTKHGGFQSDVPAMLKALENCTQGSFDLGMVAFGPAFTATADLPLEHALYRHIGVPGKPAYFHESGNEDCFGVMPLIHAKANPSHAIQWATGLELALLAEDPWRYALTLDHPNGGSFTQYPTLIAQLMSKAMRDELLAACHRQATSRTGLEKIDREMTLNEIAILTRAAPAKLLGLKNKGHLGPGADADVAIYRDQTSDPAAMFATAKYVIKAGEPVIDDGVYSQDRPGKRIIHP